MATVITQKTRKYSDLDLNFTIHPIKKDINKHVEEMAVINALKNLILTNHYERPFQPDLGSNVRRLLFENLDVVTAAALEQEIFQTIKNYEPRVELIDVIVSPNYDQNEFNVTIVVSVFTWQPLP
jgi:phage baseplate assembly protein W